MKQYKTHKGSTLTTYWEGRFLLCKFKEGGELPDELKNAKFTSEREADIHILKYLDNQTPHHAKGSLQKRIKEVVEVKEERAL